VIDRRAFIGSFALGTLVVPRVASAQPARKIARIGLLGFSVPVADMSGPEPRSAGIKAFLRGLRELGRVYGQDFVTEARGVKAIQRCGLSKRQSWFVSKWR
jgi:hypothetical protein